MDVNISEDLSVDAQTIMTGRGCIIGQSGSGKSYLVGVIAEELCRLNLPFIIIDTEGEYRALKSKFNVIIAGIGKDTDVDMSVIGYSELFLTSIDNNAPVVLDVSDIKNDQDAVNKAMAELYAVEERRRTPYLVVMEEADRYVPQVAHTSKNWVEEISLRGRKRGIGLLLAMQRPANVSKTVLSQCSYGFIGKLTTENDLKAIRPLFGDRKRLGSVPSLSIGRFLPFGLRHNTEVLVKNRTVQHMGTTPTLKDYRKRVVEIGKILDDLKISVEAAQDKSERKATEDSTKSVEGDILEYAFTNEDAKAYALGLLKKQFIIFGPNVEKIDSVTLKYVKSHLCKIRIPTGEKNEYEEVYAWLKGSRFVESYNSISFTDSGIPKPIKLSDEDSTVLLMVLKERDIGLDHLVELTKMSKNVIAKSLDKLKKAKLVDELNGIYSSHDMTNVLLDKPPEIISGKLDVSKVVNYDTEKDSGQDLLLSNLYPRSKMVNIDAVYIPIYEIIIRGGTRVRIISIDGVYGKEITY